MLQQYVALNMIIFIEKQPSVVFSKEEILAVRVIIWGKSVTDIVKSMTYDLCIYLLAKGVDFSLSLSSVNTRTIVSQTWFFKAAVSKLKSTWK